LAKDLPGDFMAVYHFQPNFFQVALSGRDAENCLK